MSVLYVRMAYRHLPIWWLSSLCEIWNFLVAIVVVFWDTTPCNLVDAHQCYRRFCFLHLQGIIVSWPWKNGTDTGIGRIHVSSSKSVGKCPPDVNGISSQSITLLVWDLRLDTLLIKLTDGFPRVVHRVRLGSASGRSCMRGQWTFTNPWTDH
jgi:hypothetical protein